MRRSRYQKINIDPDTLPDFNDTKGIALPPNLVTDVENSQVVEEKYWYYTESSVSSYVALLQADNYSAFSTSMDCLRDSMTAIIGKMREMISNDTRGGGSTSQTANR